MFFWYVLWAFVLPYFTAKWWCKILNSDNVIPLYVIFAIPSGYTGHILGRNLDRNLFDGQIGEFFYNLFGWFFGGAYVALKAIFVAMFTF